MFSDLYLELWQDREMIIDGCGKLISYGECEISFMSGKQKCRINGEYLKLDILEDRKLRITGQITGFRIENAGGTK